jgi:hypothetical protein
MQLFKDILALGQAAGRGYVVVELPFRALPEYDVRAADLAFVSKAR